MLGQLHDARGQRDLVSAQLARPAAPVPSLISGGNRVAHGVRQAQLVRERARESVVRLDHAVEFVVSGHHELERDTQAVQRLVAGADPAHRGERRPQAAHVVRRELGGLQRYVVPEPLRLLVRVRVAADVNQQRGVVDRGPLLLRHLHALSDPQCDQALPQDVLHGLPEAEVDAQRQRRDELREANV